MFNLLLKNRPTLRHKYVNVYRQTTTHIIIHNPKYAVQQNLSVNVSWKKKTYLDLQFTS